MTTSPMMSRITSEQFAAISGRAPTDRSYHVLRSDDSHEVRVSELHGIAYVLVRDQQVYSMIVVADGCDVPDPTAAYLNVVMGFAGARLALLPHAQVRELRLPSGRSVILESDRSGSRCRVIDTPEPRFVELTDTREL